MASFSQDFTAQPHAGSTHTLPHRSTLPQARVLLATFKANTLYCGLVFLWRVCGQRRRSEGSCASRHVNKPRATVSVYLVGSLCHPPAIVLAPVCLRQFVIGNASLTTPHSALLITHAAKYCSGSYTHTGDCITAYESQCKVIEVTSINYSAGDACCPTCMGSVYTIPPNYNLIQYTSM